MDNFQAAQMNPGAEGTWVFYEIMPNDAHFKFADLPEDQVKELLMPGGWHGRPAIMAPPEKYQEAVDQYLRDGKPATDADPPEQTRMVVELTQAWKQDVDAPEAINQLPTRNFDVNGLALAPQLRQGAPSEFQPGDKIELDYQTAQSLINQGIAKPGERIYRRPLRDYAYQLTEIARQTRELIDRSRLTDQANKSIDESVDKAKHQIAVREAEKKKLGEDQQHVNQEREAMQQYLTTLKQEYQTTLADLRATYAKNLELVDRLRRIEQAIINAIQQQLAAAPAAP
jgi:hypothetical protein